MGQVLAEEEANRLASETTESSLDRKMLQPPVSSLKVLRGKWAMETDAKTVITVHENGHTLYNGRHWGNQLDPCQRGGGDKMSIDRADGWSIDMDSSNTNTLVWKKGAEVAIRWRRIDREEKSWEKLWRLRYRNPPQGAQQTNGNAYPPPTSPQGRSR